MSKNVERAVALTKVLDTFLFTHEFDLLELRLRVLWDHVDKFLLMEGDHNFANQPKPMRFHEQEKRFEWAKEKLHVVRNLGPMKGEHDHTVHGELHIEHQHRQAIYNASIDLYKKEKWNKDDILLISDVDEIPSREAIERLRAEDFASPLLFNQDFYYYNIKCHRGKRWHGTIAMRFGYKPGDIGSLRMNRAYLSKWNDRCGWHFAHFYDSQAIKEKLQHSSHQGYYTPEYYDPEHLRKCVEGNKNYLGKKDGDLAPEPIPQYLLDELKRFPIMMGDEWR